MNKIILLQKPKKYKDSLNIFDKKELASFVKDQFKQLTEKNLRVPIKLYHL